MTPGAVFDAKLNTYMLPASSMLRYPADCPTVIVFTTAVVLMTSMVFVPATGTYASVAGVGVGEGVGVGVGVGEGDGLGVGAAGGGVVPLATENTATAYVAFAVSV